MMTKPRIVALACSILVLAAAACGGDGDANDAGASGGGSNADIVAQSVIDSAAEQGVELDDGCIRDAVSEIPEADLQIMVDNLEALDSGDADVDTIGISEEGMNGLNAIFECVTGGAGG
ncbi:MAG: hypothetical protein FGM29_09060 [Actinobacteria bacterium]|nr:hypothetical protein [Actinomycetota bacterium]